MSILKPCPFCGGRPFIKREWYDLYNAFMYSINCTQCGSKTILMSNEKMATNRWNKRVKEE